MTFKTIKLKNEWMGNPKGSVLTIRSEMADILVDRKTAVIKAEKNMESPEVNKMIDSPKRKKRTP